MKVVSLISRGRKCRKEPLFPIEEGTSSCIDILFVTKNRRKMNLISENQNYFLIKNYFLINISYTVFIDFPKLI